MKFFYIQKSKMFSTLQTQKLKKQLKFTDHYPVMYKNIIEILKSHKSNQNSVLVGDMTLGCGSLTKEILDTLPNSKVFGFDLDPKMINYVQTKLSNYINDKRLVVENENFTFIDEIRINTHFKSEPYSRKFDLIIADLGYNSMQLSEIDRGISHQHEESELDMRFDQSNDSIPKASDILNNSTELELMEIFRNFSEEKNYQILTSYILHYRENKKIIKVKDLIEIVNKAFQNKNINIHSSMNKIFQGLRICVNYEMLNIQRFINNAIPNLENQGILLVISFHSLEDKIVKFIFNELQKQKYGKLLFKNSVKPSKYEVLENSKSKSAIMRGFIVEDFDEYE